MLTKRIWFAFFIAVFLSWPAPLVAQSTSGRSCDVPLVVTGFDRLTRTEEVVKNLRPDNLVIQVAGKPGILDAMGIDTGPKRVALILDASNRVPDDEQDFEAKMAARLLQGARPDDKFALLLEGEDSTSHAGEPWISSGQMVARLRELNSARPIRSQSNENVYDTVFAATRLFDPPAFGDSLFVFGHPEDAGSTADPDELLRVILKNGLRLFGISFRDPLQGRLPPGFNPNKPLPLDLLQLANPKLAQMSAATGYFFSFNSVRVFGYPHELELFESFLDELYEEAVQPYRLKIRLPNAQGPTDLNIAVLNHGEGWIIRSDNVHYPHSVFPCSQSTTP
jgi:hypothetical protein